MKVAITSCPTVCTTSKENYIRQYHKGKALVFIGVTALVTFVHVAMLKHGRKKSVLIR
jgi:hypothetical protein